MVGGIVSALLVGWISIGTQVAISKNQVAYQMKNFSIEGCNNFISDDYLSPTANLSTAVQYDPRYGFCDSDADALYFWQKSDDRIFVIFLTEKIFSSYTKYLTFIIH